MREESKAFMNTIKHPVKTRMFLFMRVPAAFFSGVRIQHITENSCVTTVPFTWFSKNPFRSTYFACLAMAAELSTGAMAMMHIYKRDPSISMLITEMRVRYFKKATGITTFTCNDGENLRMTVEKAITSGEPQSFTALSTGVNKEGTLVAEFEFRWSFKVKGKRSG